MKRTIKKLMSVTIVLGMLFTALQIDFFSVRTNAAGNIDAQYSFKIDSVEASSGGIVEIPVRISNNGGIKGFSTKISYDSNSLTPIEVKSGAAFSVGNIISNLEKLTPGELNVVGYSARSASSDGVMYTVIFKVSDKASGSCELQLSYDSDNTYDGDMEEIIAQCKNGTINITQSSTTKTLLYIENQTAVMGDRVKVPIKIKNQNSNRNVSFNAKFDKNMLNLISVYSDVADVSYTLNGESVAVSVSNLMQCHDGETVAYIDMETRCAAKTTVILNTEDDIDVASGVITINDNLSLKPTIYSSSLAGKNDSVVAVPICIKNNPGIAGYKIKIAFDSSVLCPEKIEDGIYYPGELNNLGTKNNEISVIWINLLGTDVTENGELFTIYFRVLKEGVHNISVSYSKADTFNGDSEEIDFVCVDGKIFAERVLIPNESKNTIVDTDKKYIYGLDAGFRSINSYVCASEGYSISEIPGTFGMGTSSKINVMYKNEIVETYTVIIFGDVNGDGWYDGQDAVLVNLIASGVLTREQVGEAVWMAADCNHDGKIDQADVDLLNQAGLLLTNVSQS